MDGSETRGRLSASKHVIMEWARYTRSYFRIFQVFSKDSFSLTKICNSVFPSLFLSHLFETLEAMKEDCLQN